MNYQRKVEVDVHDLSSKGAAAPGEIVKMALKLGIEMIMANPKMRTDLGIEVRPEFVVKEEYVSTCIND